VLVSNVSIEVRRSHGAREVDDSVNVTTPRTSVRPAAAVLANGNEADEIWPLVTVKFVALPITAPLALRKEIVPVHDAAVPSELAAARLTTLICAVSELARPTGVKSISRVLVVLPVWANAPAAQPANAIIVKVDCRMNTLHLSF